MAKTDYDRSNKNLSAFPNGNPDQHTWASAGMSLRDYFAGQALAGIHARDTYDPEQATPEQRARLAYLDADAMLLARKG